MRQRSEEWFKARCGRITGSRFAAAMSERTTRTYNRLVEELVRERATGRAERSHQTPAMQWGIDYEPTARDWYASSRRVAVGTVGFVVHPDFDYVGVSPDGLVGSDGLVEIKCPQPRAFKQVMASGCVPARYLWQIQGQLWVCRREWVDFVFFYPPSHGRVIRVYPEQVGINALAERCAEIHIEVERRLRAQSTRIRTSSVAANTAASHGFTLDVNSQTPHVRTDQEAASHSGLRNTITSHFARWWIAAAVAIAVLYFLSR